MASGEGDLHVLNLECWTPEDVLSWIRNGQFPSLAKSCEFIIDFGIDGNMIFEVDDDILNQVFKNDAINKRKFQILVSQLKQDYTAAHSFTGRKCVTGSGSFQLTSEACMITMDTDPRVLNAKMFCGHVISPQAMYEYVDNWTSCESGHVRCADPNCDAKWPLHVCKDVANMTEDEYERFSQKMARNMIQANSDFKQCHKCRGWVTRPPYLGNDADVRCSVCKYRFCWFCSSAWDPSKGKCSNTSGCDPAVSRRKLLQECDTVMLPRVADSNGNYGTVSIPRFRACPYCREICHHTGAKCKHAQCTNPACMKWFCYICLSKVPYTCGDDPFRMCPNGMKERQTE